MRAPMPPSLDIYVRSRSRDRETILRFVERYVDRDASNDREDEELMILRLGARPSDLAPWEWEPARTLDHIIERGLDVPWRAFTVFLKTRDERCDGAELGFTVDGSVVFGLSVDDAEGVDFGGGPVDADAAARNCACAKEILHELAADLGGDAGFLAWDQTLPLRDEGFPRAESGTVPYVWSPLERSD